MSMDKCYGCELSSLGVNVAHSRSCPKASTTVSSISPSSVPGPGCPVPATIVKEATVPKVVQSTPSAKISPSVYSYEYDPDMQEPCEHHDFPDSCITCMKNAINVLDGKIDQLVQMGIAQQTMIDQQGRQLSALMALVKSIPGVSAAIAAASAVDNSTPTVPATKKTGGARPIVRGKCGRNTGNRSAGCNGTCEVDCYEVTNSDGTTWLTCIPCNKLYVEKKKSKGTPTPAASTADNK